MPPFFPETAANDDHVPSSQNPEDPGSVSSPIHWRQLHALTDGDEAFALILLKSFLADGDRQLTGIRSAIAEASYHQAYHYAHQIKGASANVGILNVEAIASQIEQHIYPCTCAQSDSVAAMIEPEYVARLLLDLEDAFAKIRAVVRQHSNLIVSKE